ncbi:MAG TPA: FAD-binding protein, partial [Pseudolabrys sp.]|nr:FAD-binding protein [Pseudolabrys sp.]
IPGLYACGNDMASVMAGSYPGPGTTLGPAIVFACRAAMHAKDARVPERIEPVDEQSLDRVARDCPL